MRWTEYINTEEVEKAISVLQEAGSVFEVRAIGTTKKNILSGYFKDASTLLKAFDTIDVRQRNIYVTLQQIKDECFARAQSETFLTSQQATSDTEVTKYRWLFVDLDPVRTAGISSTDQELADTHKLSKEVVDYLDAFNFPEPVLAMSGNGYHLLYRIDVVNDENGRELIEKCLKVLSDLFDTEKVKVDTTNSNPSRICKLHGTLAQKGRSTKDRPHRMSRILSIPSKIRVTSIDVLQALASELPDVPVQDRRTGNASHLQEFDLIGFMARNGMTYREGSNDRAKIFYLDSCPFDPSHKDGDSKIFLYHNGAIAFKCHHNSCKKYVWQDVRLKYEPDAYDRDDGEKYDLGYQEHKKKVAQELADKSEAAKQKKKAKIRKLKTADDLMKMNLPEPKVFVGLGDDLPLLVEGTCILSAKPKLGKSWFALNMCLAIAEGEDFLEYKTRKCSVLYLDLETSPSLQQKRLKKALGNKAVPKKFYLDNETNQLEAGFCEQIEAYLREDSDIGVVVVDVFQIIRTQAKSIKESEYDHAYRDITPLNDLAHKYHISIILVCHDRKDVNVDDPFVNILGSTGLQGAVTQMIVMFRQKKEDPIHISVKGKTIDGLPELDVELHNAKWSIVEGATSEEREEARLKNQYMSSPIRQAAIAVTNKEGMWRGRCSGFQRKAVELDIPLTNTPKSIGAFFSKHIGRFLAEDGIKVNIIKNGTGSRDYVLQKITVDTVDEKEGSTVDGWQRASDNADFEIPFS